MFCGFNTVMMNTCDLPFDENVRFTKQLVKTAHPVGIEVHAELGRLSNYGEDEKSVLTDPTEAFRSVELTNVDALAISIGNVHLKTEGKCEIDITRLKDIRKAVDVPLVIHGGTGLPEDIIVDIILNGVSLFHIGTIMKKVFFETLRSETTNTPENPNYQQVIGSRKEKDVIEKCKWKIKEIVKKYIRLFKSDGKAETFISI